MAKNDNSSLGRAKKQKKDEFYTRLEDIVREPAHYKEHFRGKTVLCNCDDPRVSNFFHYFSYQFEIIGLGAGDLAKQIGVKKNYRGRTDVAYRLNGVDKSPYSRIIIRRRRK